MKNGYDVFWTTNALNELKDTLAYLENNFSEREIIRLITTLEKELHLLAQNPNLYQKTEINGIHRIVILKFNSLYFRLRNDKIEILSFFSNRNNPIKRKL